MEILTSYFSKIRYEAPKGFALVSIASRPPFPTAIYKPLAPPYKIFTMKDNPKAYIFHLQNLDPLEVLDDLRTFFANILLLCWEGPGKFCHRHLVADWLNRELSMNVREWEG